MLEIIDHGEIREIRLARPPVNALNLELVTSLTNTLLKAQRQCNAVVLSGREKVFSAGLDIVELIQADRQGMKEFWSAFFGLLETIACSPVPVAAAITGHSPAGGAVMGLMCDFRVMSLGNYRIGLNETQVGLVVPWTLHQAMQRLVGSRITEQMVVAGTMIGPEKALEIGLVDALEPGYQDTTKRAVQWCENLLSLPRSAMLGNRANARAHFKEAFAANTPEETTSVVDTWFSDETQAVLNDLVSRLKGQD